MRLLKLCDEVQEMIVTEMITAGHARALITIEDPNQQYALAQKIFDEKLNVRDVEKLVKKWGEEKADPEKPSSKIDETLALFYKEATEALKTALGTKVSIVTKGNGAGKIEIEFYGHEDFDRLVEQINKGV
jgi:ParB family chromosome partitioning protein